MQSEPLIENRLERAGDLYRSARTVACLNELRLGGGVGETVLRARANLRLGRPELVVSGLLALDLDDDASSVVEGEISTLLGAAQSRLFDAEAAQATFDNARAHAFGSGSLELEAEYRYYDALRLFGNGELAKADREADYVCHVDLSLEHRFSRRPAYFVPLANSKARALVLRSLIAAGAERYREGVAYIRSAINEMERAETRDLWIYASLLKQLAINVRDFDLVEDAEFVRKRMAASDWPSELDATRCQIDLGLASSSYSCGENGRALDEVRHALHVAPTDSWRVASLVDLARILMDDGDRAAATVRLGEAVDLAGAVDWENVGEERITLVDLSEALAPIDASRASAVFEKYKRIRSRLSPSHLNTFDRRARAYELRAEAAVSLANGERKTATLRYLDAFEIWDALGYTRLAAGIALELASLCDETFYGAYVRRENAMRPTASLTRRIAIALPTAI